MINSNVSNIEFLVANTDGQALSRSLTKKQIQLGRNLTCGLGAGSDHLVGEQAALESIDEIMSELGDINMLFIATGMGGGTGTGAAPVIAKAAKEKGITSEEVLEAMEVAIGKAGRTKYGYELDIRAQIDKESGYIGLYRYREVVTSLDDFSSEESINKISQVE